MNDTRYSIPLWKRIMLCVLVFLSLFFLNLKIFSFRARANVVDGPASDAMLVHVGAPFRMAYTSIVGTGDVNIYNGVLIDPNVYYIGTDFTNENIPVWREGVISNSLFQITYQNLGTDGADLVVTSLSGDFVPSSIDLSYPVFFDSVSDSSVNFNFGFYATPGNSISYILANYVYTFCVPVFEPGSEADSDDFIIDRRYIFSSIDKRVEANGYYNFSLFGGLSDSQLADQYVFHSDVYGDVAWLDDVYISFTGYFSDGSPIDFWTNSIYFEPYGNSLVQTYDTFVDIQSDMLRSIVDPDYLITQYDFEDISWTDWLVNSVSSFMNFEIVPNLSFAGMLALLVGMSLFMVFLKVFAGG